MNPETKKFLERLLIFRHRPEVSRVIFISTPHRGSALASNWVGHIGITLVKLPELGRTHWDYFGETSGQSN